MPDNNEHAVTSEPTPEQIRMAGWVLIALNNRSGDSGHRWDAYELIDEATRIEESRR